jgi:hypothetical protein
MVRTGIQGMVFQSFIDKARGRRREEPKKRRTVEVKKDL